MPKTYTDDVAAGFPDLVQGPFRVVDAANPANYLKIDPATAAISAIGGARPTRSVPTAFLRTYVSNTSQFIGTAIPARSIGATESGGFYTFPIRVPEGMDFAEPSSVKILAAPLNSATTNGQYVRFSLVTTRVTAAGVESTISVTYDWPVPDNWQSTNPLLISLDNGNGRTFDANTFALGDTLGFRLARLGADTQDTFDKSVKISETILFEYRVKTY